MKAQRISAKWSDKLAFEALVNGHKITIDAVEAVGGQNRGPQPKPFLQLALAGCTGMDVVSILKKMKVDIVDFTVHVDGDITEQHPKHYSSMHIVYEFTGKNLPMDKLQKAVDLSQNKYCGVSYSLKKSMNITSEILVNDI